MLWLVLLCARFPADPNDDERGGGGRSLVDPESAGPPKKGNEERDAGGGGGGSMREEVAMGPTEAPETWRGEAAAAAAMVGFIWKELIAKWPLMDLAFGIKYLMGRRGNLQVSSVYSRGNCLKLKGHKVMVELVHLLSLLDLCMLFSKKRFPEFLKSAGYSQKDVLLRVSKAGILKPAFTVLCNKNSKCFLLVIRGMHSTKDLLTALNASTVPFCHSVLHEDGGCTFVTGFAHCGMVAAARWIAKCAAPCFLKALNKYPDYSIKIIGNSLGAGTAALLTCILRERKEFSSSTCVAFAPGVLEFYGYQEHLDGILSRAACMTWNLAESGKHFITTIINGSDQVPSCSITSIDNLRVEVSSSLWLNDLWDRVRVTRFFNAISRHTSSLGSHLASISCSRVDADANALQHPASSKAQVVFVRNLCSCSFLSCMGEQGQAIGLTASHKEENAGAGQSARYRNDSAPLVIEQVEPEISMDGMDHCCPGSSEQEEAVENNLVQTYRVTTLYTVNEGELRFDLVKELRRGGGDVCTQEGGGAMKETSEESVARQEVTKTARPISDAAGTLQFYPPGRIMHMIAAPVSYVDSGETVTSNESIGLYETSRDLYCTIRLCKRMIKDHYMTMYKKTIELLIDRLGKDENSCADILL